MEIKMKKICVVFIVLLMVGSLWASQEVELRDLVNPGAILIDNNQMYVVDSPSVFIYSLKDFKLKKKFGKVGEGPQEFKLFPNLPLSITLDNGNIVAKSLGKLSYFGTDGSFKREQKIKSIFSLAIKIMGEKLVGIENLNLDRTSYLALNLYDAQLNKLEEVARIVDGFQRGKGLKVLTMPHDFNNSFATTSDRIFLVWGVEPVIPVFDYEGKALPSITCKISRLPLGEDFKKNVIQYYKTDPVTKDFFKYFEPFEFPDSFPAVREIRIADQKLYVLTHTEENQKSLCLVYDLKGTFIEDVLLPLKTKNVLEFYPFAIKGNKVYQLIENDETETWALKITAFK